MERVAVRPDAYETGLPMGACLPKYTKSEAVAPRALIMLAVASILSSCYGFRKISSLVNVSVYNFFVTARSLPTICTIRGLI